MKQKPIGLSQHYVTALRHYLKPASRAGLHSAVRVGRPAPTLGVETLEMARVHEQALIILELAKNRIRLAKRAEDFFTEDLTPIVEMHRAARQSKLDLNGLNLTLNRRTAELAAANRQLRRGIVRRKNAEAALKVSRERFAQLLKDSLRLQQSLRQLNHRVLTAQEDERKKISGELQNEIAQTLLGINVRLLTLRQEARNNARGFKNEIASTRRLVVKSARTVRRFGRELNIHKPVSGE